MTNQTLAPIAPGSPARALMALVARSRPGLLARLPRRYAARVLLGGAGLGLVLLALLQFELLWVFALVVADGVVPLVPGEAALLSQAPAALAGGWPAVLGLATVAAVAAFLGDTTTYLLGRWFGTERFAWQRRRPIARVLARTGTELDCRGLPLIVSARLLPGWRVAITFMAGATGLPWRRFLAASALGAVVWAGYLLGVGTAVGAVTGAGPIVVAVVSLATTVLLAQAIRWVRRRIRIPAAAAAVVGLPRCTRLGGRGSGRLRRLARSRSGARAWRGRPLPAAAGA